MGRSELHEALACTIHWHDHWIMVVADFEKQYMAVYDSLPGNSQHEDIFDVLKIWISYGLSEHLKNKNLVISPDFHLDSSQWKLESQPEI
ncbi:hypothetical protein VKT23_010582 [Stygiomarasmius scandens]|uniref:Ubiquitin-like protease family profile domain-containing protein n=1 Tax=Marasmiellus scandens TaxID=2682957 RepID=A0ABR1JFV6_9AGAR